MWKFLGGLVVLWFMSASVSSAADSAVLKPRVPANQIEEARTWINPLPASHENIE